MIRVPVFKRNYRWRVSEIVDLFDGVIKRYPIGNLLFWERAAAADRVLSAGSPAATASYSAGSGKRRMVAT
jgi:hypothetical protein